jgi:hypothetical protein
MNRLREGRKSPYENQGCSLDDEYYQKYEPKARAHMLGQCPNFSLSNYAWSNIVSHNLLVPARVRPASA